MLLSKQKKDILKETWFQNALKNAVKAYSDLAGQSVETTVEEMKTSSTVYSSVTMLAFAQFNKMPEEKIAPAPRVRVKLSSRSLGGDIIREFDDQEGAELWLRQVGRFHDHWTIESL